MLRIELLGGFRASVGSRIIDEAEWRLRKARTLVKMLALAPQHRLHREEALELLWPGLLADAAVNNLHQVLHSARRTLEPDVPPGAPSSYLQTPDAQVVLGPAERIQVDVESFESEVVVARRTCDVSAYRAALELYTGDLLPEDRYEDWATARRDQLRDLYHALLLEGARLHEAAGQPAEAIALLQRIIVRDVAHEQAHAGLMRLYTLTGQRRAALRQYQQLSNALKTEVEAEPSTETQQLYRDIREGRLAAAFPRQKERIPQGTRPTALRRERRSKRWPAVRPVRGAQQPAKVAPHNLPVELTTFVGRTEQIARIKRLVLPATLVTLTGPAGCGKTRLAIQTARKTLARFPDGVWYVDFASVADRDLVPVAVMATLGEHEQPDRPILTTLVSRLQRLRALLILDNCEHLVEAVAGFIHALRAACPRLAVIVTSREALRVPGETVVVVPPLSLPDFKKVASLKTLQRSEAARLFLDRAHLARHDYAPTEQDATRIAKICHWLDGMPLAIELAAARLNVLTTEQMAEQLHNALRWLTGGRRTEPRRQQTLSGAIEWSYRLLDEAERTLFDRLSVFAGRFTLDAAEAVCGSAPLKGEEILTILSRLVEKSLVSVIEEPQSALSYRLLFVLRKFAEQQLVERGEMDVLRSAHARFFAALAEEAQAHLTGPRQAAWLARLDQEHDNFKAALQWAADREEIELGLRLAAALRWFWYVRGHISTGSHWLGKFVQTGVSVSPALRARALVGAAFITGIPSDAQRVQAEQALGLFRGVGDKRGMAESLAVLGLNAFLMGAPQRASALCREALVVSEEAGYQWGTAVGHLILGRVAIFKGAAMEAQLHLERALHVFREIGDEWGTAYTLLSLGWTSREQRDYSRAAPELEEAWTLFMKVGDRREATYAKVSLGLLAADQGDLPGALRVLKEGLERFRELEDEVGVAWVQCDTAAVLIRHNVDQLQATALVFESLKIFRKTGDGWGVLHSLETLAQAAAAQGLYANASRFLGAVQSFWEKAGLAPWPHQRYDHSVDKLRQSLGDAVFSVAWAEGRVMTLDKAIEYARGLRKD